MCHKGYHNSFMQSKQIYNSSIVALKSCLERQNNSCLKSKKTNEKTKKHSLSIPESIPEGSNFHRSMPTMVDKDGA